MTTEVEVSMGECPSKSIKFHSVHAFVDTLQSLEHYKKLENLFNEWHSECQKHDSLTVASGRELFQKLNNTSSIPEYKSSGQDFVSQLITGMSYRITAAYEGCNTRSFELTTVDSNGSQFIVTANLSSDPEKPITKKQKKVEEYNHFDQSHLDRFAQCGRPGFANLCFEVGAGMAKNILGRYQQKHPNLLLQGNFHEYKEGESQPTKVLDVYAFYKKDTKDADKGTVLRFFEHGQSQSVSLPGFKSVDAAFPKNAVPTYSDHWVSNVHDRNGYIATLSDVLGFTPKVNFNAGVVAAGEAMIESTVAGNTSPTLIETETQALVDRSQIFLPINNALSEVGHVYLYLKEIGQGVQHIANRVKDVVSFIQKANDTRDMTGQGFSFLNIPRSYYGRLTKKALCEKNNVSEPLASRVMEELFKAKHIEDGGLVNLDITNDKIASIGSSLGELEQEFKTHLTEIQTVVRRSIYCNLITLLGDRFPETEFLRIVRNKILIDIQGRDILYQIFSSTVMQRTPGTEAPFVETIQRICGGNVDEDGNALPLKAGCGGFGIRNFLTLFLSIEVTHAMEDVQQAKRDNDNEALAIGQKKVQLFTNQLDESNPILTKISDCMTAEQDALESLEKLKQKLGKLEDPEKLKKLNELETEVAKQRAEKELGQQKLLECSNKYKEQMMLLRKKKKSTH